MCGIFAVYLSNKTAQAYPYILSGLTVLQHRGQDAAGIHTCDDEHTHKRKNIGKVDKVFDRVSHTELPGNYGIGHVRYCTAGTLSVESAQPLDIDENPDTRRAVGFRINAGVSLNSVPASRVQAEEMRRSLTSTS